MKRRCVICDEKPAPPDDGGFPICIKCYEAWRMSGSVDAMTFAARRARRFERARAKGRKYPLAALCDKAAKIATRRAGRAS